MVKTFDILNYEFSLIKLVKLQNNNGLHHQFVKIYIYYKIIAFVQAYKRKV